MKVIKLSITLIASLLSLMILSCTDNTSSTSQVDLTKDVVGTYDGKLIQLNNLDDGVIAKVNIRKFSNTSVEMNLTCEIIDTTLIFDLYENMDSLMVCLTGDDFNSHYGHSKSGMDHMMDDDEMWNWMHHLEEDHEQGDDHFGGFDMNNHSFNYRFYDSIQKYSYMFEGVKSE